MSTFALFERHKQKAQEHENSVHSYVEDSTLALRKSQDGPVAGPQQSVAKRTASKGLRSAIAQQRLAVREYREAHRLRPRDVEVKDRLRTAGTVLRRLQVALDGPKPRPLRRFLAHYNLSIRYWDLGKAKQAMAEAEKACQELRKLGMSCGCAEHNLLLMAQVHSEFRAEHQRLQEALERAPEAVGPNYELGIHFFDKRMLLRAEAQLRYTREKAKAMSSLQFVEQEKQMMQASEEDLLFAPALDGRKARRTMQMLQDVEDDLEFVSDLRKAWCVEEEAGKTEELQATGIRDGPRPHLLPCLHRRYSQDTAACDAWCAELLFSPDLDIYSQAPPQRPKSAPVRRSYS